MTGHRVLWAGIAASMVLGLAACTALVDRLKATPVGRITAQTPDQACDAPEQNDKRLTGAFLRNSAAAGENYVPMLIRGRESRVSIAPDLNINDLTQVREVEDSPVTIYQNIEGAGATLRPGFGAADTLPNVYDLNYASGDIGLAGPVVAGPGAFFFEIPSSGATIFAGKIALEVTTRDEAGAVQTVKTEGRFAMQAGYGSGSGTLTASAFEADLPFDTLSWSKLHLCGTRFISSGAGIVSVRKDDGPALQPFKADRDPATFRALFESALFAPVERPAPPVSLGGVFVIQSDNGTMTAVFLSDPVKEPEADA